LLLAIVQLVLQLSGTKPVGRTFGDTSLLVTIPTGVAFLALLWLGCFVAARRPDNPIGWLLAAGGSVFVLDGVLQSYAGYLRAHGPGSGDLVVALENYLWIIGIGLAVILVGFLFPTGRLLSRRWRWVAWPAAITLGVTYVALTADAASGDYLVAGVVNPLRPTGALLAIVDFLSGFFLLLPIAAILSAVAIVIRYRRGDVEERHQVRIVMCATAVYAITFGAKQFFESVTGHRLLLLEDLVIVGVVAVPAGVGIAVLKYRLYDIDVVINRALVYGSLAGFITAVYVGIAVGIGALLGNGGKPNLGLSILATAIVAVGFQPVRQRLQRIANRLVYGNRATPYEVLSQFSERVAESYAVDDVLPRMARLLAEGTGAQRADVWLRSGEWLRAAAVWPAEALARDPVALDGDALPAVAGADTMVPVRHQADLLGALSLTKRTGESLTPVEENLLADLAHQAGLVLKNVGLTADLQTRLDELRASRQRLVTAQDEERRRLERNLHDGAQQHLVALKVKLGLTEMLMRSDPERARATIGELKTDADEALNTLRDLARGIYPPLLADKGLSIALQSQARKATVPVTVHADGIKRYSQELEAAVYFCVLEALQNVEKYARASLVTVALTQSNGSLSFEVRDDGCGFDPATKPRGSGLVNMYDRLDALGGQLTVDSAPGSGTRLRGDVPATDPSATEATL